MQLRTLHRTSALAIVAFASVHIANHLASLAGVASHIAFMDAARGIYRQPLVEIVLLGCVAFQAGSGLWLAVRGWSQRRGLVPWLQAASGIYLAFFLLVHVGAVLFGRAVLHLDTNFHFAAAGFHVPPYPLFFGPYYFTAVLALFTHMACAAWWRFPAASGPSRNLLIALPMLAGATIALLIVLSLAGRLQPVDIPDRYTATYRLSAWPPPR